jgi:hypothetical protein
LQAAASIHEGAGAMLDILLILAGIAAFALFQAYSLACERL